MAEEADAVPCTYIQTARLLRPLRRKIFRGSEDGEVILEIQQRPSISLLFQHMTATAGAYQPFLLFFYVLKISAGYVHTCVRAYSL